MIPAAILWDLDGTVVDSAGDIVAAVNRTLVAAGLPELSTAAVRRRIGHGAHALVSRCVADAGGTWDEALLTRFLVDYRAHVAERTVIHPPELRGLLDRLAHRPMAIVTNKPEGLTLPLLDALDLRRYFPVVLGGDSTPTRKPEPGMLFEAMRRLGVDDAVVVGDGDTDVIAGHAAGLRVIGVGWGIGDPQGADLRAETVPELEAMLAISAPNRYP